MTTCIFKCINEAESAKLMDSIWQPIMHWEGCGNKEIVVFRYNNKVDFYVAFSAEDRTKASVSLTFEASEETGKNYNLIIICEDEEIRVPVPTDISANMFYEKDRIRAQGKIVKIR